MFSIWWPAYVFPCIMVLCGLAGRLLPGRKYRSPLGPLTKERQEFADRLLLKLLWQFGPVVYDHAFRAADGKQRPADPAVHRHYSANNRGICLDFAGGTQYEGIF